MRQLSAWVVFWLLLGHAFGSQAQGAAYGDWQLHLPARHPRLLAEAGDRLYVADESSFYYYDKALDATRMLSRRDGLSDVGVQALAYDSASAQLVVVYASGNIDLLGAGGTVRNVTDLLRKQATAKSINQVQIFNGLAYISTSLGIVVLDLAKREVRDTYGAIGPSGTAVTAYATAVLHDTIFAATSAGILRGRLSSAVNLLDYRSWVQEVPNPQNTSQAYEYLAVYQGHLVAAARYYGVSYLAGTGAARSWRFVANSYGSVARRLRTSGGQLLVAFENNPLRRFDAPTGRLVDVLPTASTGPVVTDALREADGTLFVASYTLGLLRFGPGATANPEVIQPNGPATALAFGLVADAASNTVDVLPGGYSGSSGLQQGRREGFYEYHGGQWTNYTSANYSATDFPNLLDLSRGTRLADGTLYLASYGNGLLAWKGPGQFQRYTAGTPAGSPLRSSLDPDATNLDYVRVTDVAADPSGRYLWVVNRHQRANVSGLLRFEPGTGRWQSANYAFGLQNLDRVVVDAFGNPWATQSRKEGTGLMAYDTTSRQAFNFGTANGLPSNSLYCVARDRAGAIWVGTAEGVAYVGDPSPLVGAVAQPTFTKPVAQSGNGLFPTLYNESVTCIAIDGANRKWFGTPNGLWLFNATASEALLHFTTANSPLPSNTINDLAVNDKTGEVFVATDAGVVSYQGSASLTEGKPSCAQVFPNPVRPEFAGTVGIRGVVNNAQVKITDIAGHLVYSTTAAGGTVTWNLTDAQGQRVRSGVYLVLSSDAQGQNTCVSKVAVLSK
ncbi:T9SS type A sorting domain-containing protein [Hymenobacter sp. RP-2-7]|uniref:T9SS type A sorting domain-containing protein n=1 Tax=Hymenobacter polaris TaxID=2682546 RepID=A0A7Y0AGG0_9BACT|nr:two-component regulator propeller domain-containing protein [Hymenobacter polaris]NML66650.1 T9SS type A sorting domain-containing protein [Hymenobacter polaris]